VIVHFTYIPGVSPIHRLDPRTKLILLLCSAFTAASLQDLRVLLVLLALAAFYYSLARLPWRATRAAWSFFLFFIVFLVGSNTLLMGTGTLQTGDLVLVRLGWMKISWHGVISALCIVCRMLIGAFLAIPITFTIPPTRFGAAFRGMGFSDQISVAMDLAIRLIPTYARDFQQTMDAQRARGFELDALKGGLLGRLRRLAPLVVPVTMNAILSGEDITNALDMRGFGTRPRTWIHARSLQVTDRLLIILALCLLVGGVAWRFTGGGQLWMPSCPCKSSAFEIYSR